MVIFTKQIRRPILIGAITLALTLYAGVGNTFQAPSAVPAGLPTATDWKNHLEKDLMAFWLPAQTVGEPGDFPTYRCNDGNLYDETKACPELAKPATGIVWLKREYLRMKSRQIYGYGVAYHVTGDPKYLDLAKQGVDYLMKNGFEKVGDKMAPITYWETTGKEVIKGPPLKQRTSQDMAYSLTGIGFYYYLTRDPEVLKLIKSVKEYIFDTYFDEGQRIFHWVNENFREETTDRYELTAQLDQVYAYMIWLTPSLPLEDQIQWKQDLRKVAQVMKERFYAGDCHAKMPVELEVEGKATGCGLFWGDQTQGHFHQVGKDHNDYGHSVKTMWMIYTVGKITGDKELEDWGRKGASQIIERAYDPETGSWMRDPTSKDKEWWILCELDQTAGTLAMTESKFAKYLPNTWEYWNNYMVDKENHEVWHLVTADGKPDMTLPKQHSWKNMMHSTEHALVGYITASQLYREPVDLYFAWKQKPQDGTINPYIYKATIVSTESIKKDGKEVERQKVIFKDIH